MNAQPSVTDAIRSAILAAVPDAGVDVTGNGGGHYSLVVRSPVFAGRSMLENHRLVLQSIATLMSGPDAPVHAVDSLRTLAG